MTHEKVKFRKSKGAYRFYGQWPMAMGDVTLSTEMQHFFCCNMMTLSASIVSGENLDFFKDMGGGNSTFCDINF